MKIFDKSSEYYDPFIGNWLVPADIVTPSILFEAVVFLQENPLYALCYLRKEDGYEEDYICVTEAESLV